MTFKELKDYVIRKLQENKTPEYWSVEEISDAINEGYANFVKESRLLINRVVTAGVNTGYFRIPNDAQEILNVYWKGKELTPISINQLNRGGFARDFVQDNYYETLDFAGYPFDASGEPRFWTIVNGLIRIIPFEQGDNDVLYSSPDGFGLLLSDDFGLFLPTSTDEDILLDSQDEYFGGVNFLISLTANCMIEYVKHPKPLVNDHDIPDIPIAFHIALAYYALFELFSREGTTQDLNKATFYYKRFKEYCYRGKNFFKPRTPKINLPFYV